MMKKISEETSSADIAIVPANLNKKITRRKKLKSFRDIIQNESAVGKVGRTGKQDAISHIENTDLEKRFISIVKEIGGKTVARELLQRMNNTPSVSQALGEKTIQTPQEYLRDAGYKIKSEEPTKKGFEIGFYKQKDAENAYDDLTDAGFSEKFSLNVAGNFLEYIEL